MARRWTSGEENLLRSVLNTLYVKRNLSLKEISQIMALSQSTIYKRLIRLKIPIQRHKKPGYNNKLTNISIPRTRTSELAELVGILLGDGNITSTQVRVTIDSREREYIAYIRLLIEKVFGIQPKVMQRKNCNAADIYFGSVEAVRFLEEMGFVRNKVKFQIGVPKWTSCSKVFKRSLIRGFCDTDGSVYLLKSGQVQISFTNRSKKLLEDLNNMLESLSIRASRVGSKSFYLTRKSEVVKYREDIGFSNPKHRLKIQNWLK
jgi:DNA-binding transcriptional regulator WhiA